ncbi:class I adenylate-forming enzyme family protein [Tabrizicola fusiformis]|uniref:class I adenylate-forming enzyme family protein n=1 Tax=Tabrizicola sp. SY72 TaxID=2741673 RepID=UPI001571D13E|nr:class I adenylate-forming enzyme family protein [Tabrizicola sp. SY72]NTT87477.1 acyl--CoA ligase [Tabrizicola sp. SY72]
MDRFPPCPAPFNLAAHALARAGALADKSALQVIRPQGAERWSYGRLEAAVRGFGSALLARGLLPGERVLLRLGNSAAFPVGFLGAIAAGLVPVPTSAALTGPEVTRLAARIAPALVLAEAGVALPDHPAPVMTAAEVLAAEALPPCDWAMGDPDRLAYIVFTSGSTGAPLAVAHAHRALWARGMMHQGWEGLGEGDRLLHAGAFNWTFTLGTGLLDPWVNGATALIPGPGVMPAQLPLLMKRFDATILAAAPGVIRQMLKAPVPALPRLRHGLVAGEALAPSLRDQWRRATGTDLHEALGMSECSTYLSGNPARPAPEGFTGYPQPGRQLRLIDGQIALHRSDPGLMLGYLDAPEATAARFDGDWFLTGDLAEAGPDGALRFLGRADDMMNPGGFRVSPLEVEGALAGAEGVTDLAVCEIALRPGVSVIACAYVAAADLEPALIARADQSLARWKQPRLYRRLPALPRNANAKLNRRALRAELESADDPS